MADFFGAQSIPISTAVGTPIVITPSPADPLLTYLLSFLKTAANVRLGTEFGALMTPNRSPAAAESPVAFVFEHDPEQGEFNDTKLPALFMFRNADGTGTTESLTADWQISTENLTMLWVCPAATQGRVASRSKFPSKLFHLFSALIDMNRDKSWRVSGDTDTLAATEGSDLAAFAKFFQLCMVQSPRNKPLVIPIEDAPSLSYPCWEARLQVKERLTYDVDNNATLTGLNADIVYLETTPGAGDELVFGVVDITSP